MCPSSQGRWTESGAGYPDGKPAVKGSIRNWQQVGDSALPAGCAMASTSTGLFLGISSPQDTVDAAAGWDPAPLSAVPTKCMSPAARWLCWGCSEPRSAHAHLGKPPKVSCRGHRVPQVWALREKRSVVQGSEGAFVKYKKKSHSRSKTQARWSENWILPWGEELPGSSQHPQDKAGFNLSRYRNNVQDA